MADASSVTVGYWVGTGSRDEDEPRTGASHFLEHLLFKGTPSRTARQIAEQVDAVGGELNAFTTKEYTSFYVRVLEEHLDLGLDILCDIIWSPALRPDEVEAERQVILEEILMHSDEPADVAHERAYAALFPDHPLGREVAGERESVAAMAVSAIRDFFDTHYRPENMVVAAAGVVDHDRMADAVEERFAGQRGGARPARTPPASPVAASLVSSRPTEQAHVVMATRAPDRHDERRYALSALNHVLGGGLSSRLFQEIRERRGLAYSVYSERTAYDDSGALTVYAGTAPEHAGEVVDLVGEELDRLQRDGVSEEELAVARGHQRGELLLSMEDSATRMGRIGRSLLLHDEVLPVDELLTRTAAVTVEQVGELAAELFGGPRTQVVVGPFSDDDFGPGRVATPL